MAPVSCRTGIPDSKPNRRVNGLLGSTAMRPSLGPAKGFRRAAVLSVHASCRPVGFCVSRPAQVVVSTPFVLSPDDRPTSDHGREYGAHAGVFTVGHRPWSETPPPAARNHPTPTMVGKRTSPGSPRQPETTQHRPWSANARSGGDRAGHDQRRWRLLSACGTLAMISVPSCRRSPECKAGSPSICGPCPSSGTTTGSLPVTAT